MNFIDAHVHVWTENITRYPISQNYSGTDLRPLAFLPDEILKHAEPHGISGIVLVQMSYYGYDNSYMLDVMKEYEGIFSGIAVVDSDETRPDLAMRELINEGVRGFRIQPSESHISWLDSPGYGRMFCCAADEQVAICPLIDIENLPGLKIMCGRFPDTTVVVDHLCRIGIDGTIKEEHIAQLCSLAYYPKIYLKVSAFYALGQKSSPYKDLAFLIERVYNAFGPERLMWGSDCPYQVAGEHNYGDSFALIDRHLAFLSSSDRDQILRNTAKKVFF